MWRLFCFTADKAKEIPSALDIAIKKSHKNYEGMRGYQTKMLYKLDGCAASRARDEIIERVRK